MPIGSRLTIRKATSRRTAMLRRGTEVSIARNPAGDGGKLARWVGIRRRDLTRSVLRQGPVSALLHGIVEYLEAALLIAAPFLFGFDSDAARAVSIVTGVGLIVVAATTDFPAGLSRTLPAVIHVVIDLVLVGLLIAAP